jgi:hypothetical protein
VRGSGEFLLVSVAFWVAGLLASAAFAQGDPAGEQLPCAAPNIRTDVRPRADGPPTEVAVGMYMIDLTAINDPDQTLTGDLGVLLTWTDPRLARLEGCEIPLDDVWSPQLVFLNSGRMFPSRPREVDIGPAGSVTYSQRYYGTMATYHDLADFPFDEQVFRVSLMPVQWTDGDIRLVVHERATGRRELLNISFDGTDARNGAGLTSGTPLLNRRAPGGPRGRTRSRRA